jgi:hypothetical protein
MRRPYVCSICKREISRKWNFQRHIHTVHRSKKDYQNFGVNSFEHSSKIRNENFERRRASGNYNSSPKFYINHNNHYPSRSPLNPTHYESNLTSELDSDVERKKKINHIKVSLILSKLEKLRVDLIPHFDVDRINQILSYLYHECILNKDTKPIDEFQNFLPFKLY